MKIAEGIEFAFIPGMMRPMQYIFFAAVSYITFFAFALFQTPAPTDLSGWKEIGMGTAFIGAFFFLMRFGTSYIKEREEKHTSQLEKKDEQILKLASDVLEISKNAIAVQTSGNETNARILKMLESLDAKI